MVIMLLGRATVGASRCILSRIRGQVAALRSFSFSSCQTASLGKHRQVRGWTLEESTRDLREASLFRQVAQRYHALKPVAELLHLKHKARSTHA